MDVPSRVVEAVRGLQNDLNRVVEVGAGGRFDVAAALADAFPGVEVVVTDRSRPDPPAPLVGKKLVLGEDQVLGDVDVVVAIRLPPELWADLEALADRCGAAIVLAVLPEESPPETYEQVEAGVYVRA